MTKKNYTTTQDINTPQLTMFKFYLFAFFALNLCLIDSIQAQNNTITLNEISVDDKVEIKNNGTMTINISTFYLCDFPAYAQLSSLTVESGSLTLTPGSLVVVSGWTIAGNDGELGLYTTPSYTSSSAMMDYVEWGSTGHTRSSVAQAAGIWTAGDFVPAFMAGQSISYAGSGNTSASWTSGAQTLGSENGGGCIADGGTLTSESFTFCVGDDSDDMIMEGAIALSGNVGTNSAWVLTTEDGIILDIPASYADINFDDAGAGICLIWHLSYEDDLTGAEIGLNAADLQGCFSLSNSIEVVRNQPEGGVLIGGPFTFCAGDGSDDMIMDGDIIALGNSATNSAWVLTDESGNILDLPATYSEINFDLTGGGTFFIWYLSYEDGLVGAEIGMNAFDLSGCFALSDAIEIFSTQPEGGVLEGGPFVFCVGDANDDMIMAGDITLSGNEGQNSQWVITDEEGNILDLPLTYADVNFNEAFAGNYFIWHLSYEDGLTGAEIGLNGADLSGCFSLSNSIEVVRNFPLGGMIEGGPFTFCAGDGSDDMIMEGEITLTGNNGSNGTWVLTDMDGIIIDITATYSEINFDGLGAGTSFIWYLSYEDGLMGAEVGMSAFDLAGCFSLSNPIEIFRNQPEGGTLEGGPFVFCIGDGSDDLITEGDITLSGNQGPNSQWVITDAEGNIVDLPASYADFNFNEGAMGNYFVWNLTYEDGLTGAEVGMNAADLMGCFSLSNSIEVVRNMPMGGLLEGGPFTFCVGDGNDDMIAEGSITLTGNNGSNSQWVVTDVDGIILDLPSAYSEINFDEAEAGTCLIWHLSYEDGLIGAETGLSALDLQGCFSLSNSIEVIRNSSEPGSLEGGILEGGPFVFCVGDDVDDMIMEGAITLSGNVGTNSAWVLTTEDGVILDIPTSYADINFDDAGAGICLIWHISYEDGLIGAEPGLNASDLVGCFSLSNSIEVVRNQPMGGVLEGGPFTFCVGDGSDDMIMEGEITLSENSGSNGAWVLTDIEGTIIDIPSGYSEINFDGFATGTSFIWYLSYEDGLIGAEIGMNAFDLSGCFSLSNPIEIFHNQPIGGVLEGGPFEFCVGDGADDMIMEGDITLTGNEGTNTQWVVTDADGNILDLPSSYADVNFDESVAGNYFIWNLSYEDGLIGAEIGMNAADLSGCFSLSNSIEVIRNLPMGGTIEGGPFTFCVGNGEADNIQDGDITLTDNSDSDNTWLITDADGIIVGITANYFDYDFDDSASGEYQIWNLSFYGDLTGVEIGMNAADLSGCISLSNPIMITTTQVNGGTISGGPFEFCVSDDVADMIAAGAITLAGNTGSNNIWVITETDGTIIALPSNYATFDFTGSGAGTCLIWHLTYEDGLNGATVGLNASGLEGCFELSNSITITKVTSGPLCVISVEEVEASTINVQLYPNPTSGEVNLQVAFGQVESKVTVQIMSSTGQLLNEMNYDNRSELNAKIDVTAYSSGLYFMVVKTTDRIENIRFTKE